MLLSLAAKSAGRQGYQHQDAGSKLLSPGLQAMDCKADAMRVT